MSQPSVTKIRLKIILLRFYWNLPGANELSPRYNHNKPNHNQTMCTCNGMYHYSDLIMAVMASQITSLTIVYLTVYSGPDQRKHQSSMSLALVLGIHQWPVNSLHKWPVMREMFPFDNVIMLNIMMCIIHEMHCISIIRPVQMALKIRRHSGYGLRHWEEILLPSWHTTQ